ncbi:MAG: 3-oxoacyl-ACP reductase FabG [Armatimonadetes bacterium]|nr:3-oxoacyl-ACP reductase FabG [Armatimonadota bacterium]
MLDRFRLDGKVALVTGGNRGLGRAIGRALAEAGADVALMARDEERLRDAAREVGATGRRVLAIPGDVARREDAERAVARTVEELGGVHILVNNAGVNIRKPFLEYRDEEWEQVLAVNLRGVMFMSRACGPHLIRQRWGRIVNIGSTLSVVGNQERSIYAATKGAVLQLTRVLALEWAPHNVTVNCVCPGPIATEMTAPVQQNPETNKAFMDKTPLRRWGTPEDVAACVLFLSGEASGFVTGTALLVDGGWTAQ